MSFKKIELITHKEKQIYQIFFCIVFIIFVVCTVYTQFNPFELIKKSENFWLFITEDFCPPELPKESAIPNMFLGIITTIAMAISATTIGAIAAFFVGLFASEAVSPKPRTAKYVRGFATFLRNIPVLVWAFILFSSLGIGIGVGFVALFITSFSFMVRAFAETMDDISSDSVECLRATGASFGQQVYHAIIPSCLNGFLSWFLYCIEVNIRASTVVGMVGGGGIGLILISYIKGFDYHVAFTIILLIVVMVILVDRITGFLKAELDQGFAKKRERKSSEFKDGYFVKKSGELRVDGKDNNNIIPIFLWGTGIITIIGIIFLDIDWLKMAMRIPKIGTVFFRLAQFDFSQMDVVGKAMLETISVTALSTIYGAVFGLIIAIFAAKNVFKIPFLPFIMQSIATFCRAVPTAVWVLLVMVCIGMGPSAGIAGLCVHTTAFFVKVFAQTFESIPSETLEALEATGVGRFGVFMNAVLPSSLSQIVAWIGMRFEINFAECAILGMVGAGGIGFVISNNIQGYEYGVAGVAIMLVFIFAYLVERIFINIKKVIH